MNVRGLWRDPRLQSLIVIVLLVAGSMALVVDTLLSWRAEAGNLSLHQERTAMLEQRAAGLSQPKPKTTVNDGEGKVLIDAQTTGLVSAEFQRFLSTRAQQAGAVVRTVDVPQDEFLTASGEKPPESIERIRLTADIEVMEQALPDLLYAIEAGTPVMIIDAFTLRLNRKVDMLEADASMPSGMDRPLSLRLTLSAFRQKGPQS